MTPKRFHWFNVFKCLKSVSNCDQVPSFHVLGQIRMSGTIFLSWLWFGLLVQLFPDLFWQVYPHVSCWDFPLPVFVLLLPFFCVHLCFICSSALGYLSVSFSLSLCQVVCFVPSSPVFLVMFYLRLPVSSCYSGLYFVLLCALGLVLFYCQSFLPAFCFLHFGIMDYSFPPQLHLGLSALFATRCQMHQFLFLDQSLFIKFVSNYKM